MAGLSFQASAAFSKSEKTFISSLVLPVRYQGRSLTTERDRSGAHDTIAQDADAFDLKLDHVSRFDEAHVLEPTTVADRA